MPTPSLSALPAAFTSPVASTAAAVTGTVTSLVALDANTIVAGTSAGRVYLSTNGGTSYTWLGAAVVGSGDTYVMPDVSYATNKIIYVANAGGIFSWTVDTTTAWILGYRHIQAVTDITGLMMGSEGTIYGSGPAGVRRSLDAYAVIPGFGSTAALAPARVVKVLDTGTPRCLR